MTSAGDGPATGHRRTMELLAAARPARLDPDEARREPRRGATVAAVLQETRGGADGPLPGPVFGSSGPARGPDRGLGLGGRPRPAVVGAGLTLAACAAAVAVVIAAGGAPGAPGPSRAGADASPVGSRTAHTAHTALSARQILLTAAVSAARQPATGRYWRVAEVSANVTAAGPNAHPYALEQQWGQSLTWDARSPHQRTWTFPAPGYRSMPATPGAAAAWRADGSPRLPAKPRSPQAWWQTGGAVGGFGNSNLTFAQFQRLPASPAGLAATVQKAAEQQMAPVPKGSVRSWSAARQTTLSQNVFGVYVDLLRAPITPAVRATVFRNLARVPGVHSTGQVTDPLGRAGYGIGQSQGGGASATDDVLVIAPGSGQLLAEEYVTGPTSPEVPRPASGAAPGVARCPKGTNLHLPHRGNQICKLTVAQARQLPASEGPAPRRGPVLLGTGPILELAPGQLQGYDMIVSAGWTDASPPLPPRAQRFSVARDSKG